MTEQMGPPRQMEEIARALYQPVEPIPEVGTAKAVRNIETLEKTAFGEVGFLPEAPERPRSGDDRR